MKKIRAFFLGMREFRRSLTTAHDDLDLRDAYDSGRDWAHKLTARHWDK